jgi:class 3 adenylate cyclase
MIALYVALALAWALAAGLAVALVLGRRRQRGLERALGRATDNLEHLERAFHKFAPEGVVERLATGNRDIPPERRDVTVMFADLVGFTRLSLDVDPGVLVPILNDYFRRMSRIIREHHGHVSRIMGDGLMALFGALEQNTWQSADAVRAALAMREALQELNAEIAPRSLPRLAFGVGVNRGDVLSAVVGSNEMMEFTVIGDAVNLAARVETLTRQHGVDILITDAVRDRLDDRFELRELPPTPIKGRAELVRTWEVLAFREGGSTSPAAPEG